MGAQKLFNYLLQNLETANNIRILWEIIKVLKSTKTKLILYTYDAFLFDIDKEENVLPTIIDIFNTKKLNIKISYGKDYDFTYDGEEQKVDLTTLKPIELDESQLKKGSNQFEYVLPKSERKITFKLLTGNSDFFYNSNALLYLYNFNNPCCQSSANSV